MATILTNDMGSIFVQPGGPNSAQYWLGCHDLGDVSEALGDVTREYCPDPNSRGKLLIANRTRGSGSEITVDITFPVGKTADYLEELADRHCPVGLYANWGECGQRNWENIFDRGFVLEDSVLTAKTASNVASARSGGEAPTRSTRTFSFSGKRLLEYYNLRDNDRAVTAAQPMLAIEACSWDQCLGACGQPGYLGQVVYATDTATAVTKSVLYESLDFGVTWNPRAAFNADVLVDENVGVLVCFPMTPTTTRILMGKTETVGGAPARVFYTDDAGVTYSAVINVGATNGEFFPYAQSLFALSRDRIWACTDSGAGTGNIYFSSDGGLTWTLQFSQAVDGFTVLHFADENNGAAFGELGQCWVTTDGGAHWYQRTAVAAAVIRGCLCLDANRFWAATVAGTLWYTQDGGVTWAQRNVPLPAGATAISLFGSMDLIDDYCFSVSGLATIGGNSYGMVARTWDGGMNWETWTSDAVSAATSTDIDVVSVNSIYVAA